MPLKTTRAAQGCHGHTRGTEQGAEWMDGWMDGWMKLQQRGWEAFAKGRCDGGDAREKAQSELC